MQFTQGLHRAVQQRPEAIATVCGNRRHSYRELADRVARLAGAFQAHGIQRGDRVCILSLNSDRYLETYLALAWTGAVVNPANFRWSVPEVIYSIQDSACVALLVDDQFAPGVADIRAGCPSLREVIFSGDGACPEGMLDFEQLISSHDPVPDTEAGNDDLFGIFYTGGTTGAPKGVMLSHRNLLSAGLAFLAEGVLQENAVGLHAAPMFHLADMMLTTCLVLRGGTHVVLPAFAPDKALDLIEAERITDLLLVPAMIQVLVDFPATVQRDTSSVQHIMYGASPAAEALLLRTMKNIPTAQLYQVYGMTEMSAIITVMPPALHAPEARAQGKLRSAGRSALHVRAKIVGNDGIEVARGNVGEIIARGPGVMKGYLNKPEATSEAIRDGWMHTGDMGYMDDDGCIYVVDRKKDMIISGGENIYCAEVENAIATHPAVALSAVIGIPDPEMGEKVHAAVILKPASTLTADELYAHCKIQIAGYKCPRSLAIVDALPTSGAGKILKTDLRKPFWQDQDRAIS